MPSIYSRWPSKKVQEAGVTNVELKITDAAQTGLPGESIDLVFLFGVIHALPLDAVLPELYRLLKPDGTIALRGFHGWVERLTREGLFTSVGKNGGVYKFKKFAAM
jgi:ubiquinone/menaquinone biosynthesis C-methylase UbiE